jgi:translation initiation factor eIF-2B subunit delta
LDAFEKGIDFKVIVVDGRPHLEGKETVAQLSRAGIDCTYVLTSAIPHVINQATKVIVGSSSVLSNGDLMARVGTSLVCMAAKSARIPVMAVCEIYKFSESVRLDSIVWNELGSLFLM